jgi:hypothetical protein
MMICIMDSDLVLKILKIYRFCGKGVPRHWVERSSDDLGRRTEYLWMYVCMSICMYVHVDVCACVINFSVYLCMYACVCMCMHVCLCDRCWVEG